MNKVDFERVTNAIKTFKEYYEYLDFSSYDMNELNIDIPNDTREDKIYSTLFDFLVMPLIQEYRNKGLTEDEIIFNFFGIYDDEFYIHFYRPCEDVKVTIFNEKIIFDKTYL